jgi:hypothetical protein
LRRVSETTETSNTERAVNESRYSGDVTVGINSANSEITTAQVNDTTIGGDIVGGSLGVSESSNTTLVESTLEVIVGGSRGGIGGNITVQASGKVRFKFGSETGARRQGGSITNSKVTTHFFINRKRYFFFKKKILDNL